MPITRMDEASPDEWNATFLALSNRNAEFPDRVLKMLRQLETQIDGFAVNQLEHGLQTATRAERAGASEEMVVAALCHDIGKVVLNKGHPEISAAILKPFVSPDVYMIIKTHQDFQLKYYSPIVKGDPNARLKYEHEPWYELACRFSDEWDQCSFDPKYDSYTLDHFEPMIRRVFAADKNRTF